jgi:hypothetical protein
MGLWPTHRDESALLRFIDSKQVTRNFRGSAAACYQKLPLNCRPDVMQESRLYIKAASILLLTRQGF